jgi:hypothetical protein
MQGLTDQEATVGRKVVHVSAEQAFTLERQGQEELVCGVACLRTRMFVAI